MKKEYKKFKDFISALEEHCADIVVKEERFASGKIKGYTFRLFQEYDEEAYLCINDELSMPGVWTTLYDPTDIDEWVKNHSWLVIIMV